MYLKWKEITITDFSEEHINSLYTQGYVFTRLGKGKMDQTRSARVDLSKFELSSENRRILKKTDEIKLSAGALPYLDYNWKIGKQAKDFYDTKFGDKTFSANKIKELMTDDANSNFNLVLTYCHCEEEQSDDEAIPDAEIASSPSWAPRNDIGYAICHTTDEILHYSYPFYDLKNSPKDMGLGMMTRAIVWAKENGKKYVYLGSASRPSDTYKMQFAGFEWFDGSEWSNNLEALKNILNK
ncbi:hypothetical protein KKA13_00830 [Patescibacteria group bacterium]|nr:hypothetical protein [Patescibacteria group bacterium]